MDTTGDMLDWIFQVNMKSWATREDVGYLIEALNDIFNPQSTLCSGGSNGGSINSVEYLKKKLCPKMNLSRGYCARVNGFLGGRGISTSLKLPGVAAFTAATTRSR